MDRMDAGTSRAPDPGYAENNAFLSSVSRLDDPRPPWHSWPEGTLNQHVPKERAKKSSEQRRLVRKCSPFWGVGLLAAGHGFRWAADHALRDQKGWRNRPTPSVHELSVTRQQKLDVTLQASSVNLATCLTSHEIPWNDGREKYPRIFIRTSSSSDTL